MTPLLRRNAVVFLALFILALGIVLSYLGSPGHAANTLPPRHCITTNPAVGHYPGGNPPCVQAEDAYEACVIGYMDDVVSPATQANAFSLCADVKAAEGDGTIYVELSYKGGY